MVTGVGTDGRFLDRRTIAFVSNSVGIAQHNGFLRGGKYKFKGAGDIDWGPPEEAPDADEWPLPERLGVP
jgi:hypothetical protein